MRAIPSGTRTGRPSKAAVATASTEPDTRPAGRPSQIKVTPPASATASVSEVSTRMRRNAGSIGTAKGDHEYRLRRRSSTRHGRYAAAGHSAADRHPRQTVVTLITAIVRTGAKRVVAGNSHV